MLLKHMVGCLGSKPERPVRVTNSRRHMHEHPSKQGESVSPTLINKATKQGGILSPSCLYKLAPYYSSLFSADSSESRATSPQQGRNPSDSHKLCSVLSSRARWGEEIGHLRRSCSSRWGLCSSTSPQVSSSPLLCAQLETAFV